MEDLTAFSAEDVRNVAEQELALACSSYTPVAAPAATLLAGQPGAGKTLLSSDISARLAGNAFLINGDEYRRFHPNYRRLHKTYGSESVSLTSAFSAAVTEDLIERLSDRRINLIIEGTGRTVDVPKKTAELLAKKGYIVRVAVVAARPVISLTGTLLRFYRMSESGVLPRATALSAHDKVIGVLPENVDALTALPQIAGVSIWTRGLEKIYDSAQSRRLPSAVLRGFWSRPWPRELADEVEGTIRQLRRDEARLQLGQGWMIDEAERRLQAELISPEDALDAAARRLCEEAYQEYVESGRKSRPIRELWQELDLE